MPGSGTQGWGGAWGLFPWGGLASVESRIAQKIIAVLKATNGVSQYVGTRVYGKFRNTITDRVTPLITIGVDPSAGRETNPVHLEYTDFEIAFYMHAVGQNAKVWDDMMECVEAALDALHNAKLFDTSLGIRLLNFWNVGEGPQTMLGEGLMYYPTRWRAFGTIEGAA